MDQDPNPPKPRLSMNRNTDIDAFGTSLKPVADAGLHSLDRIVCMGQRGLPNMVSCIWVGSWWYPQRTEFVNSYLWYPLSPRCRYLIMNRTFVFHTLCQLAEVDLRKLVESTRIFGIAQLLSPNIFWLTNSMLWCSLYFFDTWLPEMSSSWSKRQQSSFLP